MGSKIKSSLKLALAYVLLTCGFSLGSAPARAQTWDEFFRQKKTQEKYLLKQIGYLKLYAQHAWKGYRLVGSGLETIGGLASGEFRLHDAFISALSKVGPLVSRDARVQEIVKYQLDISASFRALLRDPGISRSPHLSYLKAVQQKVAAECGADLDELMEVVLSGDLEMDDSQRLSRLGKIHGSMSAKAAFSRWFCAQVQASMLNRNQETTDIESIRRLYEKN